MKDILVFDTTDASTIAESDSVGAYLRSSDGTLITHTSENGDLALDVHLSNTSIAVTATDLDIRNLVFATDKVDVSGSTLTGITNDVNIADGGNSITVDAVQLDIDDLNATDDAVAAHTHDGSGTAITSTAGALDVNIASGSITTTDAALANTAIASAVNTLAVADTAEDVVAAPLASRKYLLIYNNDNRKMYVGASGVSSANGFPLSPSSVMELRAGAAIDIEWVSAKVSHDIRTLELS